ncbi:molybdopterin-dependent oxidoreductase [Chelatococcus asaccharovorans]|uniref:Biotin/methionine sulfoxide reductase n=1 Tax=Chelatococcus asaccharovorans TaxID=28210 RepID=A0A2V3U8D9_9HYPH|nr:molybdopterin-dependent oxidoreductase [Chelatococcus asaccharovorans]MBS7705518.1 molybdopterin-dependent oxidoreductase [Chelatococcus asaccharovorans]PXW60077.1 biotin/methionine sulfoxide reductase [Chelatococcus asaccharovorans]
MHHTLSHWGLYEVVQDVDGPRLVASAKDPDPSPIGLDQLSPTVTRLRVKRPAVRRSFLEGRRTEGHLRGKEPFVEVEWDEAIALVASELERVIGRHGNSAIFGGSYGWSSAGRFHHAQGQIHRFLNCIGGYVRHRDSYSHAAANVVLPHIVAPLDTLMAQHTSWDQLAEHCELFVGFGGVPLKNAQVTAGGAMRHHVREGLEAMRRAGTRFILIGPLRADLDVGGPFEWIQIRPNTDTALMLGLMHCMLKSGRHDSGFLDRYCVGFDTVSTYLTGRADGVVKDAEWAAGITGVAADRIETLATEIVSSRTMMNVAWSLQRARHGEQPYWALITLAAMIGQIGTPGGGFGVGYGAVNSVGTSKLRMTGPTFPQLANAVSDFIPVARIADLLSKPGQSFSYNGNVYRYPDIKLVYWAGGNPFHHHQDLNTLAAAWAMPEAVIVHEQYWNPVARMADIVLPATTTLERNDLGYAGREGHLVAMKKVAEPHAQARDDYDIFAQLAARMNVGPAFTEGRDETGWLQWLYAEAVAQARKLGMALPSFEEFWDAGLIDLGDMPEPPVMLGEFRADPKAHALPTPSGKIELFSATVAGFGYQDCPGHAVWLEPDEWLGAAQAARFPLHLISNQPSRRLHSQLDHAAYSVDGKVAGREVARINPADAARRGISGGDVIRLWNDRGSCLAAAAIDDGVMPGVVVLPTGAWYDPDRSLEVPLEKHGNPNVLTLDRGTSSLAQGSSAQTCLVEVERFEGGSAVTAFDLPEIQARAS